MSPPRPRLPNGIEWIALGFGVGSVAIGALTIPGTLIDAGAAGEIWKSLAVEASAVVGLGVLATGFFLRWRWASTVATGPGCAASLLLCVNLAMYLVRNGLHTRHEAATAGLACMVFVSPLALGLTAVPFVALLLSRRDYLARSGRRVPGPLPVFPPPLRTPIARIGRIDRVEGPEGQRRGALGDSRDRAKA